MTQQEMTFEEEFFLLTANIFSCRLHIMTATTVSDFEYTLLGITDYTKELKLLCREKLA